MYKKLLLVLAVSCGLINVTNCNHKTPRLKQGQTPGKPVNPLDYRRLKEGETPAKSSESSDSNISGEPGKIYNDRVNFLADVLRSADIINNTVPNEDSYDYRMQKRGDATSLYDGLLECNRDKNKTYRTSTAQDIECSKRIVELKALKNTIKNQKDISAYDHAQLRNLYDIETLAKIGKL